MTENIIGLQELNGKLLSLHKQFGGKDAMVEVSFGTNYALYVHENLEAHHPEGEAKFLEKGSNNCREQVLNDIQSRIKTTNFGLALYIGGLRIQREAQKLTPVEFGLLRMSARTDLVKGTR